MTEPAFTAVKTAGGLLPPDLLGKIMTGKGVDGLASADYHLAAGETVREAANRSWSYLTGVWRTFRDQLATRPESDRATTLTRERWLLILFRELGFGRLATTGAGGIVADGKPFPISHEWDHTPIHLLGWRIELDHKTPGVAGAAEAAPQSLMQECLNRSEDHLWAMLSDGRLLRVLRDSTSLVRAAYVEFDLEAIFDGELFSDFVLLYLVCHQSRFEVPDGGVPADCWLERWRTTAIDEGTRALDRLRDGVQHAIEALGTGFLAHPANGGLRADLADGSLRLDDYYRALLRLVYRLLFLFVAEDRDALLDPDADKLPQQRYHDYFSTARLRAVARTRRGGRHGDLWHALRLVIDGLGREGGRPELALPALGGLFDSSPLDILQRHQLPNSALLDAVRSLSLVRDKASGAVRAVDYRNLGAEELGSVYESLLEETPRHDPETNTFALQQLAGNERKTSGSYYTPTALVELALDEALDPLLDRAAHQPDPQAALLAVTVCDPACGSGHFLVAAARRIAKRFATLRTGDPEPTEPAVREALHDVVARCVFGVDVNPMAAELARVSLWIEALQPGRPLTFLDAHIKVGNALLGTTPALLAAGLPDAAFKPIEGDDRSFAAALAKRNKSEREGNALQGELFAETSLRVANLAQARAAREIAEAKTLSLADVHVAARRYRDLEQSADLIRAREVADAWCAAFVQHKIDTNAAAVTQLVLEQLDRGESDLLLAETRAEVNRLAGQYRLFHWHLEFPEVFDVPEGGATTPTGWTGGFTVMIGNPPWERVKLQEKEFFAARDPDIANAKNAAARKKLIAKLPDIDPVLARAWSTALRTSEGVSHLLRDSGRYPLCGVGDVNTYAVFAEHFRTAIGPDGRMGILTPTGLATDATTAPFFGDTLRAGRLAAFYDFENEAKIFPGVHNQFRFAVTCMTGGERVAAVRFAFYTRYISDVPARRYVLTPDEVLLLNPNTGTLPLFRSRTDAEITLGIYRRHPVLVRDGDDLGLPWGLTFVRMFDMANDSGLFNTTDDLVAEGAEFDGWAYAKGPERWLPLYEAKLLSHYDHRYATYADATRAQLNKGTLPKLTDAQHGDPKCEPLARYWVSDADVADAIADRWDRDWLLGWRDIARASDARTFVPCVLPRSAVNHKFPLALPEQPLHGALLQAAWSSLAFDYVSRQKLSGTGMAYFIVKQLACPTPETFDRPRPWTGDLPLRDWIIPRVLELSYTSWRIKPYAVDLGDDRPPFHWIPERREAIRAELDAAMFHVYGLTRPEVEHVIDSFFVVKKYEERDHGEFRTKRLVLDRYDAMTQPDYQTVLNAPPGHGPRHQSQEEGTA